MRTALKLWNWNFGELFFLLPDGRTTFLPVFGLACLTAVRFQKRIRQLED